MTEAARQARLTEEQVQAFYHDEFVESQVRDFRALVGSTGDELVVDIGGGCGFFADTLRQVAGYPTRVIEIDPGSIESCRRLGIDSRIGDALAPEIEGDEKLVSFNLILHHLVGNTERQTRALQLQALRVWHGTGVRVFVNEYIYQSFVAEISSRLIYEITSSRLLSAIGRTVSRFIPSLQANTFGVGVRFRSHEQWLEMFAEAGFRVSAKHLGDDEPISFPRRALLIKAIRRDSFLLESIRSPAGDR